MKKHYSKLLLALGMAGVMSVNTFGAVTFKDVPNTHWAYAGINYMQEKGYMTKNSSGEFSPSQEVTYFDVAEILAKATGYQDELVVKDMDATLKKQIADNYAVQKPVLKTYTDKYSTWESRCNEEIAYLLGRGYLDKSELSKFMVKTADGKELKNTVTKQDLAALLVRIIGKEKTAQDAYKNTTSFADHSLIKEENRPHVAYLNQIGLLNGDAKGNMGANTKVTRALCAQMTYNALVYKEKLDKENQQTTEKPSTPEASTGNTIQGKVNKIVPKNAAKGENYVLIEVDGATKFYTATKSTKVVDSANKEVDFSSVKVDAKVSVTIAKENGVEVISKLQLLSTLDNNTGTKPETGTETDTETDQNVERSTYKGTVENIGRSGSISVLTSNETVTYKVADDCKIMYDGQVLTLEEVGVGDQVQIYVEDYKVVKLNILTRGQVDEEKMTVEFAKSVAKADGYKMTVRANNKEKEVFAVEDVEVIRNGKYASVADLRIGDELDLEIEKNQVVKITATSKEQSLTGTVDSIIISQTPQLVITVKGEKQTINITSNTEFYDSTAREDIMLREILLGSKVEVLTESKEAISVVIKNAPSQITYKGSVEYVGQGAKYIDVLVEYDALTGETMTLKRINVPSQVEIIVDREQGYRNQIKKGMEVLVVFNYGEEMYPESIEVIR